MAKTFSDTISGARDDGPGQAALSDYVREGDTVVVWKLDRLGRNTLDILETVKALTDRGMSLVSVTDGIDSSTAAGRMMIGVLGSLAEYERELVRERTALKRATSRANGTRFGRPRKVRDTDHLATVKRMKARAHRVRPEGGVGGDANDVVFGTRREDVSTGGETEIRRVLGQHAGAPHGDNVVGVEMVSIQVSLFGRQSC